MTAENDELIKAQNEVIGILFEIIKRYQANNDFTDEYIEMSIKNPNQIDKKRLEEINKENLDQLRSTDKKSNLLEQIGRNNIQEAIKIVQNKSNKGE